ncbi:flagellar filament capping protein FliD [Cellvibrio japonicus]|uniref:Flagellar hook-associated protein 2 n=1 Tax=Cellvibrio japonicus (strain Ueda107) TaxID=498211 RepID=B3PGR3_CELJU|nr:flagellar filament capping protein FliD [Cellvibrio japonicus]ACE83683.1 Flagellar hook-associated protein 2 [Cellvibrio japonicus Ueda107]QEI12408.1 flagellar hook protein [Cellvibrio japonicus]QEI15981.1 flagellar hook protein [Cellvibrio japonicus]QEI19560.1 flagellar hook protein [Cellvibrio japonicus]
MVTTTNSTNAATGSSIISALGTGSGIDTNALTNQLVEINKAAQTQRLTTRKTLLETQISDYGLLRSSLAKLESAAAALGSSDTFNAKAVSLPSTSLLSITKLNASANAGDYQLKVEQIAQAQSLSSGTFASMNAPIGKGTLTIRLGEWNDDLTSFGVDSTKTGAEIVIDDSNNSLMGLRDAINKAGIGVSASIVSDGGSYKLLLTAKSGAKNEIEISVAEADGSSGLSSFSFNESTQNLTQQQGGLDAKIRVNGLLVSRESNQVKDVVEGLEFDLFAASTTETITINITEDKTVAETAIRDFVTAYNTFKTEVEKLVGFDAEKKDYGSLRTDPLAKNLVQGIRNILSSSVAGLSGGFTNLSYLGIRTELDGSLKIIENEGNTGFRAAIDNNFDLVRDLFVPKTSSSTAQIDITKYTANTKPGTYDVVISQQPSKGKLTGDELQLTFPLDTTGKDYSFKMRVDGIETNLISLPSDKVYASGAELAMDLQSLINLDSNVKEARASLAVSYDADTGTLQFISDAYGSSTRIDITEASDDLADLGLSVATGVSGKDVAGTVGGVAAFGYGNVLLPALGSPAEGLTMTIEPGTTSGSVTFSRGFSGTMSNLINDYLKSSGVIKEREDSINRDITRVGKDEEALERRSEAYRARLMSQFQAMEAIVRSLNSTGSFLDGILDRLPFTAKSS